LFLSIDDDEVFKEEGDGGGGGLTLVGCCCSPRPFVFPLLLPPPVRHAKYLGTPPFELPLLLLALPTMRLSLPCTEVAGGTSKTRSSKSVTQRMKGLADDVLLVSCVVVNPV
jgi:hypothetical protein